MSDDNKVRNAKDIYNQAYSYYELGDRNNLLITYKLLLSNFPNSKEVKLAAKNFKLTPSDIQMKLVSVVSGTFRKVKIKQMKGYGLYRGQGHVEIYYQGIKIIGRHVRPIGDRLVFGFLIWWIIASILSKHIVGLLVILLCVIPAYLLLEYFILKRENIFVPWSFLKSFAADPKRKLVGFNFYGFKWCSPVILESNKWGELIQEFRKNTSNLDTTPDVTV